MRQGRSLQEKEVCPLKQKAEEGRATGSVDRRKSLVDPGLENQPHLENKDVSKETRSVAQLQFINLK